MKYLTPRNVLCYTVHIIFRESEVLLYENASYEYGDCK